MPNQMNRYNPFMGNKIDGIDYSIPSIFYYLQNDLNLSLRALAVEMFDKS